MNCTTIYVFSEALVTALINNGATVNAQAEHKVTPLHIAARYSTVNQSVSQSLQYVSQSFSFRFGNKAVMELLLCKGAIMEAQTGDKLTPMHCAARAGWW